MALADASRLLVTQHARAADSLETMCCVVRGGVGVAVEGDRAATPVGAGRTRGGRNAGKAMGSAAVSAA